MIRLRDVLTGTQGQLVGDLPDDFLFRAVTVDSRQAGQGVLFVALPGATTDGHRFIAQAAQGGASAALVRRDWRDANPQPPLPVIVVPETLQALHALAAWWRSLFRNVPVIGVTGSVGKTSTKELIATVLGTRFRVYKSPGNLNAITGMPIALLGLSPDTEAAVIEMALYDPGDIATMVRIARPKIGVVTNVGISHIERLGSQEAIARNKGDLIAGLPVDGVAVLNGDDPLARAMAGRTGARVLMYGLDAGNDLRATNVQSEGLAGITFSLAMPRESPVHVTLPLLGRHSVHTALAATAVASAMGLALEDILSGLEGEQTQLRLYTVPGPRGATLIDDTYNSSPQSALAALNLLADLDAARRVAVLADMLELGPYSEEGHTLVGQRAAAVLDRLYTYGPRSAATANAARAAGMPANAVVSVGEGAKEELSTRLREELDGGDLVLIKGSRGMHMEELVEAIRVGPAAAAGGAPV